MPVQSTAMRGADGYSCGPISGQSAAKDAPAVNEVAKVAFSSPRPLRLTLYSRRGAKVDGDRFVTPQRKMGVTAVDMPLVKIGKAAELLGISVQTLRNGRTPVSWFQIGAGRRALLRHGQNPRARL